MFSIPTYLERSPIHGMGVHAAVAIAKGDVIWTFTPEVDWKIEPAVMDQFPEPFQERLRAYSYLDESGFYILCGDNARFMNHSDTPNCDDTGGKHTVALRDIDEGEELTCDYRTFDVELRDKEGALYPSNGR